jgi:hypothetical protein
MRIVTVLAWVLATLALLARVSMLLIVRDGDAPFAHPALLLLAGTFAFAILPGLVCTLVLLVVYLVRSVRAARPRALAVLLLAMLLAPGLGGLALQRSTAAMQAAAAPEESAQFHDGHDWAVAHKPLRGSQCIGNAEFDRGCRQQIAERHERELAEGSAWAQAHRPALGSQCSGIGAPYVVVGCFRYFTAHLKQPKPAGQGRYEGMTTAQCQAEVNANFEAMSQVDIEDGDAWRIGVYHRKGWDQDLKECENYDTIASGTAIAQAERRLSAALDRLKAGGQPSMEEKTAIVRDMAAVGALPDQPYKAYYLREFDEYTQRIDGSYRAPEPDYPDLPCAAYQTHLETLRQQDADRVAALRALKRPDGVVTDSAQWARLNQARIDALWDVKKFTDGAKAHQCALP